MPVPIGSVSMRPMPGMCAIALKPSGPCREMLMFWRAGTKRGLSALAASQDVRNKQCRKTTVRKFVCDQKIIARLTETGLGG